MNYWLERALCHSRERALWLAWTCAVVVTFCARDGSWFGVVMWAVFAVVFLRAAWKDHAELRMWRSFIAGKEAKR